MPGRFGYSQLERNEWCGNAREYICDLLEVNPIEAVFGGHIKDSLDKRGTISRGNGRREMTGTRPSTDGDASHRAMFVSLVDEFWNVALPRGVKTED